jgi:SAM-dependent methyltransferase
MPYMQGWRSVPPLARSIGMVGSDPERFECPRCGSHDRERHLLLYLEAAGLLESMGGKTIVHFAPERHLSRCIESLGAARYLKCDLYPQAKDVLQVDLLATGLADSSVDLLIANHVLEHVDDDLLALAEIHRILKVGGLAILQTPYSPRLHATWQDRGLDDPDARLQAYGQSDHVRLYGRDIFDRIASMGFMSDSRMHAELLDGLDCRAYGVNAAEPLFLFRKH